MKKWFTRVTLFFVLFVTLPFISKATHIVGGSITYEYLGGATYRVTFKLYRDCNPGSAYFPSNVNIQVRDSNGTAFAPSKNISMPLTQVQILNPAIDTCAYNPGVCVQEAIYTVIVNNLPPQSGGYHLYYQYCCRNGSIVNITNPLSQGSSYYTFIPDNNIYLSNSSPQWKTFPPVFVCQGHPLFIDHGATDADGDVLRFHFYDAFDDNPVTWIGNQPNFTSVPYNPGYSGQNPVGGFGLQIDTLTGMITGVAPSIGEFVVGVRCDEYRNGVKISSIYRDFQLNVLNCPPLPQTAIGNVDACNGSAVQFTNGSTPITGNSFFWDFGDTTTLADTSHAVNPSYTYPGIGQYVVMLVAEAGTPCADTTYDTISVSFVNANFTMSTDSACVNTAITFTDNSTSSPNATVNSWNWNFGDAGTSTIPGPSHSYSTGGTYPVTLIAGSSEGCYDTVTKYIYIQSPPIANAGVDTFACLSNPVLMLSGSVSGASGGIWVSDSSGFNPNQNTLNATYTPDSSQLANGFSTLILSTTGNGLCPADVDTMTITYTNGIIVDAGPDQTVCKNLPFVSLTGIVQTAYGGNWTTNGTGFFQPNSFDLNGNYMFSTGDTTLDSLTIYLTSIGNGNCLADTDSMTVHFVPGPDANILNNDTACAGSQLIPLNAYSSTGSGYWTTSGSGSFIPDDSLPNTNYLADSNDNQNGSVTLIFTTTNNGGCTSSTDSIFLLLIPPPVADFDFTQDCPNQPLTFTDNSTSYTPLVDWKWYFDDGDSAITQNTSHSYDSSGYYNVTLFVKSTNGCTDSVTKQVEVYPLPNADFYVDGVCINVGTQFHDSSTIGMGDSLNAWQWDLGDGNASSDENPSHTYTQGGNYSATLIVTSNHGCKDTITKVLAINPPPTAVFTSSPNSVKVFEPFQFTDGSYDNIMAWIWNFGDSSGISTVQNPQHAYDSSGNFLVCLTAIDSTNCRDSVCHEVIVFLPPNLPNAFSPNGDGVNDVLRVLGGPFDELEFKIYNSWGQMVFESKNQADGWDGTYKGAPQPNGVFVFTIQAMTKDKIVHKMKGDVTLIR